MDIVTVSSDQFNVNNENAILTINDYYNESDICKYVLPIPETDPLNVILVKDINTEDEYFEIEYNL